MPRVPILLSLAAFLAATTLAPVAPAHGGLGGGFTGSRLEAEAYTYAGAVFCEPDDRGDHALVTSAPWGLTPLVAPSTAPSNQCPIVFHQLAFPQPATFRTFYAAVVSGGAAASFSFTISSDNATVASGTFAQAVGAPSAPRLVAFSSASAVAAGAHELAIRAVRTSGPSDARLLVDWVETATCTNTRATVSVSGDGMAGGLVGWAGAFPYQLAATASDANGDAVSLRWILPDGSQVAGGALTRSFAASGPQTLLVQSRESVASRCAGYGDLGNVTSVTFKALQAWTAQRRTPAPERGCVHGSEIQTPGPVPEVMLGDCPVSGRATLPDMAHASIARATLLHDSVPFASASATELDAIHRSRDWPAGPATLSACFGAAGDKFARRFCSELDFVNVPG